MRSVRPVSRRYRSVSSSIGNSAQVDPNSGLMFAIVARSASGRFETPGPANSTNFPMTPWARSRSVMVSTRSVAVEPAGRPVKVNPHNGRDVDRDRLAEHCGLGLDTADAPAEYAEPVDHGGVGVGAQTHVGERPSHLRSSPRGQGSRD